MPAIDLNSFHHMTYIVLLLFCGALSLLSFFIILVYYKNKEKIYLYYFLFLICSMVGAVVHLSNLGWDNQVLLSTPIYYRRILESFTLLALFFYCIFTISLLDIRKQDPKLAKWITTLAAITASYGCLYWFIYPYIEAHTLTFFIISRLIILPMSLIAIVWVSYKINSIFKGYFIIGSAFYFTGAFLAVLRDTVSNIPIAGFYNLSGTVYFQIGIFLEVVCFTLALTLRVYLLYKSKQTETVKERDLALAQVLATQTQNNSHLIFNSLNVIKYLIQTQRKDAALRQLSIYSKFIRKIIESAQKQQISLKEEINIISYYLELESSRLDYSFVNSIHIKDDVNQETTMLPPMFLQSLVEKLIWKRNHLAPHFYVFRNGTDTYILLKNGEFEDASNEVILAYINENFEHYNFENERIELYNKNHLGKIHCYLSKQDDETNNDFSICLKINDPT